MTKILYVEDDRVDQLSVERLLAGQEDWVATVVPNVAAAAAHLRAEAVDLILADQYLPDGNLADLLTLAEGVPVMVLSGSGPGGVALPGIQAWLPKPLTLGALEAAWAQIATGVLPHLRLDLTYLLDLADGDTAFAHSLFDVYLDEVPGHLSALAAARELPTLAGLIHQVRAKYRILGVDPLRQWAGALEAEARLGPLSPGSLQRFDTLLDLSRASLDLVHQLRQLPDVPPFFPPVP